MQQSRIIILTDTIQSGKTSALLQYCNIKKNCTGFLCPDQNGMRKFLDLKTGISYEFEVGNSATDDCTNVGKFKFNNKIFKLAQKQLVALCSSNNSNIIIDEIGKLEMQGEGLEPALNEFLSKVSSLKNCILILVVRNTLLEAVIEKYNLQNAEIKNLQTFKNEFLGC